MGEIWQRTKPEVVLTHLQRLGSSKLRRKLLVNSLETGCPAAFNTFQHFSLGMSRFTPYF